MIIELDEWSTKSAVELTAQQVSALARHDAFDLRPDPDHAGQWRVGARHKVGAVALEGLELRVRPKVPVAAVLGLLSEAIGRIDFDDDLVEFAAAPDLLPVVAGAFCRHAEAAIRLGLLQGYETVDDALLGVRGRMNLSAQVQRRSGLLLPVEVTYDEYSPDIIENQLLAGATQLLLALPSVVDHHHRRLLRLRRRLENVTPHPPSHRPPAVPISRLNNRYANAIALSRLILSTAALEEGDDRQLPGTGLLVDMNKLFEDVVGEGLRQALEPVAGSVELQETVDLDTAGHTTIRPDVVWRVEGRAVAVVDAKYKLPDARPNLSGDVYQVLVYAARYGLDNVHLVYAERPPVAALEVGDVIVHLHHIDIGATAELRLSRLADIAANVRARAG